MGKKHPTSGTAGRVHKPGRLGRPPKQPYQPPPDSGWHIEVNNISPTTALPPQVWQRIIKSLDTKTGPEIKQALAAISVMAKEHRDANRIKEAEILEAHIPPIRAYLSRVLPRRIAEARDDYTVQ